MISSEYILIGVGAKYYNISYPNRIEYYIPLFNNNCMKNRKI